MASGTEFESIEYAVEEGIATVRLQRAEKKNAVSAGMREELETALDRFEDDPEGAVLVLTGSGDSFSAGTDIAELADRDPGSVEEALALEGFALPERVDALEAPTIAMVNGLALGGGFELALACDLRIASTAAEFGFPEIRIGGFPGEGGTQRLPRETSLGNALLLLLTGESISAERAREYGLVQEVHPPDALRERTTDIARTIAEKDALALRLTKLVAETATRTEFEQGLELEGLLAKVLEATPERKRRLAEFLDG